MMPQQMPPQQGFPPGRPMGPPGMQTPQKSGKTASQKKKRMFYVLIGIIVVFAILAIVSGIYYVVKFV